MRNKSDIVLTCIMMAFFAFFVIRLPHGPTANFESDLTQNTKTFAGTVAADYNNNAAGTTTATTSDLTQIAPAAGDAAPAAVTTTTTTTTAPKADDKKTPESAPAQTPATISQ